MVLQEVVKQLNLSISLNKKRTVSLFRSALFQNINHKSNDFSVISHSILRHKYESRKKTAISTYKQARMASNSDFTEENDQQKNQEKVLIAGLGNAELGGISYSGTRHNVGMHFVDYLATKLNLSWKRDSKKFNGSVSECCVSSGVHLYLLKPGILMNINGRSVNRTARECGVPVKNVYIVRDDLEKPLGKIRLKPKGSASGHNGMRSVISSTNSQEIPQLLIGIGRPSVKANVEKYVLSKFDKTEQELLPSVFNAGIEILSKKFYDRDYSLGHLLEFYVPPSKVLKHSSNEPNNENKKPSLRRKKSEPEHEVIKDSGVRQPMKDLQEKSNIDNR